MKIAISGYGFVGKATEIMLNKFCSNIESIEIQDPAYEKSVKDWKVIDYHLICVSTPSYGDYTDHSPFNLANLQDALEHAMQNEFTGKTIIRSTISPSDLIKLNMLFKTKFAAWPEFLRQSSWKEDAANPKFVIMAGDIKEFASNFKFDIHFLENEREAWMMKLARNAFLALKVIVANDIKHACDAMAIDYEKVKEAMLLDDNLGKDHWDQPGYDKMEGYGGVCLPKDTKAFNRELISAGVRNNFAQWTTKKNTSLRG
jgi:UDP-glucose 6-dehydrogenase